MASSSPQTPQTRLQKSLGCSRQFLLSGLEESEKRELAGKIVELGGVYLQSENYKPACTHLICGKLSRSEKFLCGCAMGRWILHPSYITASAKKGEWLTEEDYEWVNFLKDGEQEMGLAARRWRFNVEAFMSFPFSGWKVAVIVRGARKSSIYTRLLSCGGAEIYKLTLPVGNKSRVANLLTYVFVGGHNVPEVQHLIEYGILCLRPEFIGDYILQDPPPDPLDYLVKAEVPSGPKDHCPVDIDESLMDIMFSQSPSVESPSVRSSPQMLTPSTPQGSPCVRAQYKTLPESPLVRTDPSKTATTEHSLTKDSSKVSEEKGKKRKLLDDLDSVVQQMKRSKTVHRGDLWLPAVFTGMSTENHQSGEVAGPFSNHLEGMILASLEDGEAEFFLSGLDLVVSSVTDMQFPTPHLIQVIRNKLLQVGQNELLQYHCYNVLMKILNIHPPVSPAVNDLYLALYGDSEVTKRGTVIGSLTNRLMEESGASPPMGCILLLRCIVASLEVNLQHYLNRIERGELEGRRLRFCLFAQMVWPGSMYLSVNSLCREMLDLFRLCVAEEMDSSSKRDLVKLSTSLICMAVLVSHHMESGLRVSPQDSVIPSLTASHLLHETVRHIPSALSAELLRLVLKCLTPPWIAVQFCCLLLRNLDDYLLLQELPAEDVTLKEIVTKYFFLLPRIESRQSNLHQSPHPKKSVLRSCEETRTRGKRVLKDKENERLDHNLNLINVKDVNKRNVKGETPLQVACIKNNLKKVRQLLRVPGIDVNTCDNAGWTPLHEACNLGHLEIVKELLNFVPAKTMEHFLGQGGDKKCKKVSLLATTEDQITPLHDAVMNNRLDICKLLLQHGGPVLLDSRTAMNQTPSDLAVTSHCVLL
uniref:SMC5-SMC6 complex localization factor protein 1-like isoform X2 n=1 Tax=Crassostrea virginica TaxID=6565 RepID=A0A8B8CW16_CRAVI|nr:SMC5-SMC6 complex localization factor protein 1-like isoform X2 [Crassostrea virginica]